MCRHYGLAVAIDLESSAIAHTFWELAFRKRILCHISGVRKDIIKLFPPLNLSSHALFDLGRYLGELLDSLHNGDAV